MSFGSFLSAVGRDIEKGLHIALQETQKFQPLVDVALTVTGQIPARIVFDSTVAAVTGVEQKFQAVGKGSGTGQEKLAEVVQILGPYIGQYLNTTDKDKINKYVNSVVALLNALPGTVPNPAPAVAQPAA